MKSKFAGVLGVLIVAGCCLAAFALWDTRRAALDEARVAAESLALVLERGLARSVETYALSIDGAVRDLNDGALDGLSPATQRLVLFDRAADARGLGTILVVDPDGKVRFDSKNPTLRTGTFSDRDYFTAQKAADIGLYISSPFVSRLDREWSIALSRRINNPDGSFGGIVVGTIKLSYLRELFASLNAGASGTTLSLFREDGVALARSPFDVAEIGKNYSHLLVFKKLKESPRGTFDQVALRDGVARRYVYGRVGNLPLVFSIGLSFEDILSPWRRKAVLLAAVGLGVLSAMLVLAVLLKRELKRRLKAEISANASAARFRLLAEHSNDAVVLRNLSGERTFASPKFYEFLGRSPEEVGSKGLQAFLHAESRALPTATIKRLLEGEQRASELLQCIRPDGSLVWVEAVSRLVRLSDHQPAEILTNMRDITAQKLLTDSVTQQKAELEEISRTDPLTGIANRRALDESYKAELLRAERDSLPLSVLMLDVDDFKGYNDHLGHLAGDEALRQVARCASMHARRPADLAARFGGEEFVILLPNTNLQGAVALAEDVRAAVQARALQHADGRNLAVSIGVATRNPGQTLDLLDAADHALYFAKQNGRNRVEAFTAACAEIAA